MAITFVLDISHHQDLSLDLAAARRDGCEAVFMKAGEGASMVDDAFVRNLAEARAAGQLVAAYWYQKGNATAAAHVERIKATVPTAVPLILDVEVNSGDTALTRDIIARLNAAGYRTPLLYIPRWYWQSIGSPSLAGLPPLWSSRYPNNKVGLLASEWTEIPASYWNGYGGLDVAVLQFTSSAKIAGYSPLDASAFRGTRDKLATLLGYTAAASPTSIPEEEESAMFPMPIPASEKVAAATGEPTFSDVFTTVPWNGKAAVLNLIPTGDAVYAGNPQCWTPDGGVGKVSRTGKYDREDRVDVNNPGAWEIPAGVTRIFWTTSSPSAFWVWPVAK